MTPKPTVKIDGQPVAAGTAARFTKLAAAFKAATGHTLHVRSGLRDPKEQERLFLQRYRRQDTGSGPFRDVRTYQGKRYVRVSPAGTVAVPGTSGHETGRDLDVYDSGRDPGVITAGTSRSNWLKANARRYGFDPRGLTFGEPWHIESTAAASTYWTPANPTASKKKDVLDMTPAELRKIIREETAKTIEDAWKVQPRKDHPEGTKEHTFRYHNRQSQLLYAALGGITVAELSAQVTGLVAAVRALAETNGVDPDRLEQWVREAVDGALADLTITLATTTEGNTP